MSQPSGAPPEPNCNDALTELYGFLDGELTAERRTVISGHLDHCTHCLEAFDFEAELRVVVSSHCKGDVVPDQLRRRIAGALGLPEEPGGQTRSR